VEQTSATGRYEQSVTSGIFSHLNLPVPQSYLAAGASLVWLYVIPRDVATVFITYGAVWPFFCSIVLLGLLYPFVVFVGLQTASDGILGIMDTSILPTSVVFAYLISLYGIYSSIESAIEILGGL
jgi:hypothetical protein